MTRAMNLMKEDTMFRVPMLAISSSALIALVGSAWQAWPGTRSEAPRVSKGEIGANEGLLAVPFQDVEIHDFFWSPKLQINRTVTLEACLAQSKKQGNINNFALVAGKGQGQHSGLVYHDSDL